MASLAVLAPNPLFRAGLAALLISMGYDSVEEAADLTELKSREGAVARPEILLVSLQQSIEGLAAFTDEIKEWAPRAKIVFLAPALDRPALSACFAAGAAGYLLEKISREALECSLRLVSLGENVFPSELASALSGSASKLNGSSDARDELRNLHATDRQIEILRCVANGESNRFIAKKLGIPETEISGEIKSIQRKLGLSNRTQTALWGVAKGLAAPFVDSTWRTRKTEGQRH